MLESLERIAERLRQPPSISVEVEKIKEQLAENKSVSVELEKLQPSYETLKQRGEEMIARSEGADRDVSAKGMPHVHLHPPSFPSNQIADTLAALLNQIWCGRARQVMERWARLHKQTRQII